MHKVSRYLIRFFSPGSFCANTSDQLVDQNFQPRLVVWPNNAFSFRFISQEDVVDGARTYTGKEVQIGPTYYHPDSKVETLEQVRNRPGDNRILISNMECNEWKHIIWNRWGSGAQTYNPCEDQVL